MFDALPPTTGTFHSDRSPSYCVGARTSSFFFLEVIISIITVGILGPSAALTVCFSFTESGDVSFCTVSEKCGPVAALLVLAAI